MRVQIDCKDCDSEADQETFHVYFCPPHAAAQDMLGALKKVRSYLGFGEGREPNGLRLIDVLELIDTAIAKVK